MIFKIKRIDKDVPLPQHMTGGAAGIDLYCADDIDLASQNKCLVRTGLAVEIPENHVGLIFPRSSMGAKGLSLQNTVGVIDSDYRGEILLALQCSNTLSIQKHTRVAQMVVVPYVKLTITEEELNETTRAQGGFGSTGE